MRPDAREEAVRLVGEMAANGAAFRFKPSENALPASFTYELPGDGDRQRCRRIITAAKADPLVWSAMLREIAERTGGRA